MSSGDFSETDMGQSDSREASGADIGMTAESGIRAERCPEQGGFHHARSSSLMLVFARVLASTCLTMTTQ